MSEKILLVEEIPLHRGLYGGQLSAAGYRVHPVSTAAGALRALGRGEGPDAVVLGVNRSDGAGIDILGDILAMRPEIPVVLHTSLPSLQDDFRAWGACAIVTKCSEASQLRSCIREVLQLRRRSTAGPQALQNVG